MREMKDSGIEWIDEIPLDWTAKPLKWMVKFGKGLPITKDNLIEQGIPVVSYGQIHSKTNDGTHLRDDLIRFVSEAYLESNPLSLGKKGDIFFADTSEDYAGIGNAVLVDIDTPVFAGYHTVIVRPDDQSYSRYLAYLFLTDAWRSQLCSEASGIKVFSITQGLLKKTTVILPPAEKAVAMTDYLDRKCSQIDAIIARQQEVIEKLKAYKLSVITEAVTKGLNPNVPMKDSGVEWIGEIPEHWEIRRIGSFARVTSSKRIFEESYVDEGVPFYRSKEITDLSKGLHVQTEIFIPEEVFEQVNEASPAPKCGDILLTSIGTIGNTWISDGRKFYYKDGNITQIEANDSFDSAYVEYCFSSNVVLEQYTRLAMGSTLLALTIIKIKKILVAFPPLDEQRKIVQYLKLKCSSIDANIKNKENLITKLVDYKKSLIYEVVTGKKEV